MELITGGVGGKRQRPRGGYGAASKWRLLRSNEFTIHSQKGFKAHPPTVDYELRESSLCSHLASRISNLFNHPTTQTLLAVIERGELARRDPRIGVCVKLYRQ